LWARHCYEGVCVLVGLGWVGVWEVGCEERCVKWVVR
jgi:hypothetical protein